jgi:4-hydroxy-tetrahydrodipicolinate reductase
MSKPRTKGIQGYTGSIAKAQIRMVDRHPDVELVGVLVHHEDKAGLDASQIADIDPLGVIATNRLDNIERWRPTSSSTIRRPKRIRTSFRCLRLART